VAGATITFTGTLFKIGPPPDTVTAADGTFSAFFYHPKPPGTYSVQAHFAGQGIFGPSNLATETLTV
jgi:hypothetical protein